MEDNELVVGTNDCPTRTVVSTICSSDAACLLEHYSDVGRDLGVPRERMKKMRISINKGSSSIQDVMGQIIEDWVSRLGNQAMLKDITKVLKQNCFKRSEELLNLAFNIPNTSTKPVLYKQLPKQLQDFLHSDNTMSLCIVSTPDIKITFRKIQENEPNCSLHELKEFLNIFSTTAKLSKNIQVVYNCRLGDLHQLVDSISASDMNKLVLITDENETDLISKFKSREHVQLYFDHMDWEDLSLEHQIKIRSQLEKMLKFDFTKQELSGMLHGQLLVDLINGQKPRLFRDMLPEPISYYINRTLLTRNTVSKQLFETTSSDVFLFTGMDIFRLNQFLNDREPTDNSTNQLLQQKLSVHFIVQDDKVHFDKICERTSNSVHWLQFQGNGTLRWVQSRGRMNSIQELITKDQEQVEEGNFIQMINNNQAICISDSPGMGKSVFLAKIARQLMEKYPERIVLYISFHDLVNKVKGKLAEDKLVVHALIDLACETELGKFFLNFRMGEKTTTIELLLDGFDEITSSDEESLQGKS